MNTFTVQGTVSHPDARGGQALVVDFVVGTRASYMVLPVEIVEQLGLATPYERTVELANGEHVVYPLGDVRLALAGEEWVRSSWLGREGPRHGWAR